MRLDIVGRRDIRAHRKTASHLPSQSNPVVIVCRVCEKIEKKQDDNKQTGKTGANMLVNTVGGCILAGYIFREFHNILSGEK